MVPRLSSCCAVFMTAKVKAPRAVASKANTAVLIGNESMAPPLTTAIRAQRGPLHRNRVHEEQVAHYCQVRIFWPTLRNWPGASIACKKSRLIGGLVAPDRHLRHLHSIQRHQSLLCTAEPHRSRLSPAICICFALDVHTAL